MAQFHIDSCVLTIKNSRLNIDACAVKLRTNERKRLKKSRELTLYDSYYPLPKNFVSEADESELVFKQEWKNGPTLGT